MDSTVTQLILAAAGFSIATLWGVQLWEVRNLRGDNKKLTDAIAELSAAIGTFRVQLEYKVDTDICSEHRNSFERRKV